MHDSTDLEKTLRLLDALNRLLIPRHLLTEPGPHFFKVFQTKESDDKVKTETEKLPTAAHTTALHICNEKDCTRHTYSTYIRTCAWISPACYTLLSAKTYVSQQ